MVISALVFGALLEAYTPGRLIQVIQGAAVTTAVLNLAAMWKQEARDRNRAQQMKAAQPLAFRVALGQLMQTHGMMRLLCVIALGTFGFGMADVLLEPYGGQALGLSVGQTTKLTALLATGTLLGFGIASRVLGQGGAPARMALIGAAIGVPGFAAIIASSMGPGVPMFLAGTFATGLGAGLFGHATLTATIRAAPSERTGLALGAWGAVQATAAGIGIALAGIVRDVIVGWQAGAAGLTAQTPYTVVFMIELIVLLLAILVILPLIKSTGARTNKPDMRVAGSEMSKANSNPVEVS